MWRYLFVSLTLLMLSACSGLETEVITVAPTVAVPTARETKTPTPQVTATSLSAPTTIVTATSTPAPTATMMATNLPEPTMTSLPSPTPFPVPTSDLIGGWLLYESEFYQYQFSYPPDAILNTSGVDGYAISGLPDDICVSVRFGGVFFIIQAPQEKGGQYAGCGVTGVGDYDIIQKTETVIIDGRPYTAAVTEVRERDEAATWINEFSFLQLEDGTFIWYGYSDFRKSGDEALEEYLQLKETLMQIVTSITY